MIFDGHSDLLYDVARRRLQGEKRVLERRHLPRLRRGGIEGLVLALWTYPTADSFWRDIRRDEVRLELLLDCLSAELEETPQLALVRTGEEAERALAAGKTYAFLAVEGLRPLGDDPTGLDRLAELGVRLASLTWNEENAFASGAKCDPYSGLTEAGRQAVRRMEEAGVLVDVSHLNDGGFRDVVRLAHGPVLATHSNCRALCDVPRNLTDDQLRAIRDTGGTVGVNAYHAFVHANLRHQTAEMLARHACHMAEVMGVEHVACGFDFCDFFGPGNEGAEGLENCTQTKNLFYWLERYGMSAEERELIARGNLLRVLKQPCKLWKDC